MHPKTSFTTSNMDANHPPIGFHDAPSTGRVALVNVRVFNGSGLQPHSTVILNGPRIERLCDLNEALPSDASVYDAHGKVLLPGLIDAHAHPIDGSHLVAMVSSGITTAVNAFTPEPAQAAFLSQLPDSPHLVHASFIATSPDSMHARIVSSLASSPSAAPANDMLIAQTTDIPAWVDRQVHQGAAFVKVIGSAPEPGLSQELQSALVAASHAAGKAVVVHAASAEAFAQGTAAGADQLHHVPVDAVPDEQLVRKMVEQGTVVCPTLTMMRAACARPLAKGRFDVAAASVTKLHSAGVPILAGTDANLQPGTPAPVPFGTSLHDELKNLVDAGMSPIQALNAATALPARYFGLTKRGTVAEGMIADLVLVDGEPTTDIADSRNVVAVWLRGKEFIRGERRLT